MDLNQVIDQLQAAGNLRRIPADASESPALDLSGNDYLGIALRDDWRREFMAEAADRRCALTASASRLLAARQREFADLEGAIECAYGRPALLFNSGYHANTGMIAALGSLGNTLIVADRLVHASIIDGIRLSGAPFERFRHNDYDHLERILAKNAGRYERILIVAESIYSMDGDRADIERLATLKRSVPGALLYIDEAHAVGACGPRGLGLSAATTAFADVDIIVGTMGKALAGSGAYAVLDATLKQFMINKARSLIFSTAMPPICAAWGRFVFERMQQMDAEREHLARLSRELYRLLGVSGEPSHIAPYIVGTPEAAVALSGRLEQAGYHVLPIRTPTVPPGTDRLRFSLCAAYTMESLQGLKSIIIQ